MKLIGKGSFTKCYLKSCGKKVYLDSVDPIKECMAYGWFPKSKYFPVVKFEGEGYTMKYYPKVKSLKQNLKPAQYVIYKQLRDLYRNNNTHGYFNLRETFQKLPKSTIKARLLEALEACTNYGQDICFEISPRNIAVSSTGNLILLDCFYLQSELDKTSM